MGTFWKFRFLAKLEIDQKRYGQEGAKFTEILLQRETLLMYVRDVEAEPWIGAIPHTRKLRLNMSELLGRNIFSLDFIGDRSGKLILDIGCGGNDHGNLWLEKTPFAKRNRIIGIDISPGWDVPDLIKGDAIRLPFRDNLFDLVVSFDLLEHLPAGAERQFFSEIARILRPWGYVYLSTPNDHPLAKYLDLAYYLQAHRHYKPGQLQELAYASGMIPERIEIRGGWWELLGLYDLLLAKWAFKRGPFFSEQIIRFQNEEYKKKGFTEIFIKFRKPSPLSINMEGEP